MSGVDGAAGAALLRGPLLPVEIMVEDAVVVTVLDDEDPFRLALEVVAVLPLLLWVAPLPLLPMLTLLVAALPLLLEPPLLLAAVPA